MNVLARFLWLSGKRSRQRASAAKLGGWSEALFYGLMFFLGLTALAALLVSHALSPPPPETYLPGYGFWLLVLVLSSFILLGGGGAVWAILQTIVSAERRRAK